MVARDNQSPNQVLSFSIDAKNVMALLPSREDHTGITGKGHEKRRQHTKAKED
jgi:hypothetical protein